jgi:TIR domain/SMODS-associated and fused to various effectors sensor domain
MSRLLFISYSHEDAETAARLAEELLARGISIWQDIDDIRLGRRIESEMERGIAAADAVLHVLTASSLVSAPVQREVTLALRRRRTEPDFQVMAVARNVGDSHDDVGRRTLEELHENFARDWLEILPAGDEAIEFQSAASFAKKVLRSFYPRRSGPVDGAWTIGLHARGRSEGTHDLELDWRPLVGDGRRMPGDYAAWERLWAATCDVRDVLCDHSPRREVVLHAAAHQTAGALFGRAFCANARFRITIEQDGSVWQSDRGSQEPAGFAVTTTPEKMDSTYITAEVEIARAVAEAVSARIAETGEEPRLRLLARREGGAGWMDPAAAAAAAHVVAREVKRAVDDVRPQRVELYCAAPLPFVVLLASELGALHAEIGLYEFHESRYAPSIVIPEED